MQKIECSCPPKIQVEILTPQYDGIGEWGLWEVIKS